MQIVWYTAMSLDGRIAGPGDDLGFLDSITEPEGGGDFTEFIASTDAAIVGATTIRWLEAGGHSIDPGDGRPTWLLSHDANLAARMGPHVRRVESASQAVREMADAGLQRVWLCGGGNVAGQLLALDRVDEIIATVAPVALGSGPALFDLPVDSSLTKPPRFTLLECRRYSGDAVRLRWVRER